MNKTFPIDTLYSYAGDTLSLKGSAKNYVINFWFTTCPPCVAEIKWLNKLKEEYESPNWGFLAISFEREEDVNSFLEMHPFHFKQFFIERSKINENYLTMGYPTTLIVDKSEKVIFQKSGAYAREEEAIEIYEILANEIEKLRPAKP